MTGFSYSNAPGIVRDDLYQAHHNMWQRLAKPGTWWTGAERVAIAAEVRKASDCKLCKDRMAALSPNTVKGHHDRSSDILPKSAVDVIHRVVTDSGRLSKGWFEKTLSDGLNDAQYIEIIGTVISVMSIDTFCKGVGIALHPLPKPLPGKPSYQRPSTAKQEDAWVPMISVKDAIGAEADLFNGKMTGNVMRALSLVPDEVRGLNKMSAAQYLPINKVMRMDTGRVLNRAQIELIASRVSAINECFYWTTSHAMMLRASVEMTGKKVDMNVVTGNDATVQESILFGDTLVAFAEALVRDDDTLTYTRKMVVEQMGSETLIDAAALVGNFQQMVRIANTTGIPLDTPMAIISKDMQKKLGFNRFHTAENTPDIGFLQQTVGKVLRPIAMVILRIFGVIHNTMKSKD